MITSIILRSVIPKMARRNYAAAGGATHGHSQGGKDVFVHPIFNDHPVAPIVTYDHFPVPVLSFKEGYEKPQKTFNALLAVSVIAFSSMSFYMWKNDILNLRMTAPPKNWTHRKVGKGLGDID